MRVRLVVEGMWRNLQRRDLASRLARMAGDRGPGSYRAPEFLETEAELACVCAKLAEIEYQLGRPELAEPSRCCAEQIYTALGRFLQHAGLGTSERAKLQAKLDCVGEALARMPDRYATV